MTPTGLRESGTDSLVNISTLHFAVDNDAVPARTGGSPYVCCRGDGSLVNNLWCNIFWRSVFAVVLL